MKPTITDRVAQAVARFKVLAAQLEREKFPIHAIHLGALAIVDEMAERKDDERKARR